MPLGHWLLLGATALMGCSSNTSVESPNAGGSTSGGSTSGGGSGGSAGSGGSGGAGAGESGSGGTSAGGAAGSGGGAADPMSCERYCQLIGTNCADFPQFPSEVTCLATCRHWPEGEDTDRAGNTRACRIYHATAAQAAPDTHCRHAGPAGVGTCGTSCEGYCTVMLAVCPEIFEDTGTCTTECEMMTGFDAPDFVAGVEGDHFQCRLYHSTFAAGVNPVLHCPHAGPVPNGPCSGM